jgi:hypothetical protein
LRRSLPIYIRQNPAVPLEIYPRLKPGLLVIPLNSEEFYIGEATEGVYVPSDPYLSIVRGCDGHHCLEHIANLCNIPVGLIHSFLDELRTLNYIEMRPSPSRDPGLDELARHYSERIAPEQQLYTWRSRTSDGGASEIDGRKYFSILIFGHNRLARSLLANLQASGFTQTKILTPITHSGLRIEAKDICGIVTRPIDIGRRQLEFHKQIALDSQLTQVSKDLNTETNLVISTSAFTSDYIQRWISEGVPHLQISQPTTHSLEIGPLVLPGTRACLNCVQLHRRDFLPPFISVHALHAHCDGRELTSASSSFAAGVVTPYICEYAARGESSLVGHSLTINLLEPLHGIREHHWNIHPECGCGSSDSLVL